MTGDERSFAVGDRNENRRGPFEVVAINGPSMRIRWDDGLETETTIADQRRILGNMERELETSAARGKAAARVPDWFGSDFTGLKEADFSEDVTGTHWRSREQLGGAVTKGLAVTEPFNSWAPYNMPQIHWSSLRRYKAVHSLYQAKFFARAWPDHLLFGIYLERPDKASDPQEDWSRFLSWLECEDHVLWLNNTLAEHGATIANPFPEIQRTAFRGSIAPGAEGFVYSCPETTQALPLIQLAPFLADLRKDLWVNLVIGKRLSKLEAVAQGAGVAKTIYDFFNALMPVFSLDAAGAVPSP
jgi:hypothetical protein